jgi:Dolichyl-phosphate-mannose-protein mannosyltransferase
MTNSSGAAGASWRAAVPVVLLAAVLYVRALGDVPAYLGGDEARFAIAAHSIAVSGRDGNGERMPLLFHMTDSAEEQSTRWYQPVLFYLIALVLKARPLTEASVRIPTIVIGILDVFLMYVVARLLFHDTFYSVLAAVMLAFAPAHLIFSRQALDYICPLPFVLGWLACLVAWLENGSVWLAVSAGALLGIGFYSYIAAWVMMPLYLLLTWIALIGSRRPRPAVTTASVAVGLAFAVPLLLLVPWLSSHPEMLADTIGRYKVYEARQLSPLQGVKDFLNYNNVQERISVYWDYFNPAYLFFSGGSNLTHATRRAGVFLLPVSVLLVCGIVDLCRRPRSAISVVLLAGLALAPLPATLVDERYAVQRELFVLVFAVLISVFGVAFLLRRPRSPVRLLVTVLLLLALPVQYAYFYRDYFTDYRVRSAFWFDPVDFRDVADHLIASASSDPPLVYLSRDLDDVAPRWRFYLARHGRDDLMTHTRYFAAHDFDVSRVPAGSLLVLYANDPRVAALVGTSTCSIAKAIVNVAGATAAVILRKNG